MYLLERTPGRAGTRGGYGGTGSGRGGGGGGGGGGGAAADPDAKVLPSLMLRRRIELKQFTKLLLSRQADEILGLRVRPPSPQQQPSEGDRSFWVPDKSVTKCQV